MSAAVVANGSWTDFSALTNKSVTPSGAIVVGHRAIFVLASTVDGSHTADGVNNPGDAEWGGIITLTDNAGHTWNRDTYGGPIDDTAVFTTVEIWSTYVSSQINTSGYTLAVTPSTRGLSAYWAMYDVSGLAENGGVGSPLDKVQRSNNVSTTSWTTGTTAALAQATELVIAVHGVGGSPAAPWFTDTAGFSSDFQVSGSAPGSARGLATLQKTTAATTAVTSTGSVASNSGASTVATYKLVGDATIVGVRGIGTATGKAGTAAILSPSAATLIIHTGNRW